MLASRCITINYEIPHLVSRKLGLAATHRSLGSS